MEQRPPEPPNLTDAVKVSGRRVVAGEGHYRSIPRGPFTIPHTDRGTGAELDKRSARA